MSAKKRGRPSDYTPELATAICTRLSVGESLRHICMDETMPAQSTVYLWLINHTDFSEKYTSARERQAEYWAEEILDISDDGTNDWVEREGKDGSVITVADHEHISRSKLRVDSRKWLMSKLAPKKYGDKVTTEHTGAGGGHVVIERRIVDPRAG